MSGLPERVALFVSRPRKGAFSSMLGKGGREPVMAEAEDGKNDQGLTTSQYVTAPKLFIAFPDARGV